MSHTNANPILDHVSEELYYDPDTAKGSKRLERIDHVRQMIRRSGCRKCALWKERSGSVDPIPGEGKGRLMAVGHRIGKNEANSGRPAIGDASRPGFSLLLDAIAPGHSVPDPASREACMDFMYVSNHARCGSDFDTNPSHSNRKVCSKMWLSQEISAVDPAIIVFWHRASAKMLCGDDIPRNGVVFESSVYGRKRTCMTMNHPAVIYRKPTFAEAVKAQYGALAKWLAEENLIKASPTQVSTGATPTSTVEHKLVTTPSELSDMVLDLEDDSMLALDTETSYRGDYGKMSEHERDKGALLWARDRFDAVCIQLCGLNTSGGVNTVDTTYTVAFNFVDHIGRPQQELTGEVVAEALEYLLSKQLYDSDGQKINRTVLMWNGLFDCPVSTRMGLDLLGATRWDMPVTVLDGILTLARLNEHLTDIAGMNLGSAAQRLIGETKESFDKYFKNHSMFRFIDITDPGTQKKLLAYTGEDPRKTMLASLEVFKRLDKHLKEVSDVTTTMRSSVPTSGFPPFPVVNANSTGSRLKDVAIPLDHQMVPILSMMSAVGFRFDSETYEEKRAYVGRQKMLLKKELRDLDYPYNPNSDQKTSSFVDSVISDLVEGTNDLLSKAQELVDSSSGEHSIDALRELLCQPLDISPPKVSNRGWRVTESMVKASYEETFGELTAGQADVEKFVDVFLDGVYLQLRDFVMPELPEELSEELKARDSRHQRPFVDFDRVESIFDTIFTYKKLNKVWGTYFERFKKLSDSHGIINPDYLLTGTTSGRLSGNFQNVPRGSDELTGVMEGLDVRQFIYAVQPPDLNRLFSNMSLSYRSGPKKGSPWQVREDDEYVVVTADYSAMEDRMALALTGDETKARLLSDPDLDTHFYNAAFLFGDLFADKLGADMTSEEGVMQVYRYLKEDPDKVGTKDNYRTPVKTVHYASQYGAGVNKIHSLLYPIFVSQGREWTIADTQRLVDKYEKLYAGVVNSREQLLRELEGDLNIEYPVFGTLRHAENYQGRIVQGEHLSVANAQNQGSCAYLAKYAMMRTRKAIYDNMSRWNLVEAGGDTYVGLIIQVHDELGVLCPKRLATEVAEMLEASMKIIVGPPNKHTPAGPEGEPTSFFDTETEDFRGDTGWLYMPDTAFEEPVLMDADAEVKRTIAKVDYDKEIVEKEDGTKEEIKTLALLPDGEPNLYEPEELAKINFEAKPGTELTYPRAGALPDGMPIY